MGETCERRADDRDIQTYCNDILDDAIRRADAEMDGDGYICQMAWIDHYRNLLADTEEVMSYADGVSRQLLMKELEQAQAHIEFMFPQSAALFASCKP
jgi:hypothetical protein